MIRSFAGVATAALLLLGCTRTDPASTVTVPTLEPPASASAYRLEIVDSGSESRHLLAMPLPVGLTSQVTVSFSALGESIDVVLQAELIRSGADGDGQLIELVVIGVDAGDADTVQGLLPIVGASSRLVRDERRAIVEQELDIPAGLALRADAIVRQALRAPFALAGPVVTDPVGDGASWTIRTGDEGEPDTTVVEVERSRPDGYVLRIDLAAGEAEITGRPDELLPTEQVVTLDDATLRVVAEPSGQ